MLCVEVTDGVTFQVADTIGTSAIESGGVFVVDAGVVVVAAGHGLPALVLGGVVLVVACEPAEPGVAHPLFLAVHALVAVHLGAQVHDALPPVAAGLDVQLDVQLVEEVEQLEHARGLRGRRGGQEVADLGHRGLGPVHQLCAFRRRASHHGLARGDVQLGGLLYLLICVSVADGKSQRNCGDCIRVFFSLFVAGRLGDPQA